MLVCYRHHRLDPLLDQARFLAVELMEPPYKLKSPDQIIGVRQLLGDGKRLTGPHECLLRITQKP